ncbi:hypothetical protein ACFL29_00965 [Patescibacteria group bacterium]
MLFRRIFGKKRERRVDIMVIAIVILGVIALVLFIYSMEQLAKRSKHDALLVYVEADGLELEKNKNDPEVLRRYVKTRFFLKCQLIIYLHIRTAEQAFECGSLEEEQKKWYLQECEKALELHRERVAAGLEILPKLCIDETELRIGDSSHVDLAKKLHKAEIKRGWLNYYGKIVRDLF